MESHDRGLIIRLRGRGIFEQKEETVQAITETIIQHQVRATLIDLRAVPGPYPFMDRYQVGELVARFFAGLTVAALINEDQAREERIGTLVAANRGVHVKLFSDATAAGQWLQNHSHPPLEPGPEQFPPATTLTGPAASPPRKRGRGTGS